jgi:crotonobetainyl-CoA:carnitine CoA-transferase CaiB-like acyl-CoA transferase
MTMGAAEASQPVDKPAGPLTGLRVLDLTSVVFGPLATQLLGDQGADVIKIEAPEGDTTRFTGPARNAGMAALFLGLNRNKRSLVLDLKRPQAKEALWRLIDGADVLVHSIRPQAVARLGFAPDAVLARNPRIVYAALTGYGTGGAYEGKPAYDDVIQGQSGIATLMSQIAGEPRYAPMIIGDKTCGLVASQAITAALLARERTGKGQYVEVPMLETMAAFVLAEHMFGHTFDPPLGGIGYNRVLAPWRRPYKTADGYIAMLVYTDAQWRRFWKLVGREPLAKDPRFATMAARADNIGEVYRIAGECMLARTTDEWLGVLEENEIPAARVRSLEELLVDEHLTSVGFLERRHHASEGDLVLPRPSARFGATPSGIARLQPRLGEHTREILAEAGLTAEEIDGVMG